MANIATLGGGGLLLQLLLMCGLAAELFSPVPLTPKVGDAREPCCDTCMFMHKSVPVFC